MSNKFQGKIIFCDSSILDILPKLDSILKISGRPISYDYTFIWGTDCLVCMTLVTLGCVIFFTLPVEFVSELFSCMSMLISRHNLNGYETQHDGHLSGSVG